MASKVFAASRAAFLLISWGSATQAPAQGLSSQAEIAANGVCITHIWPAEGLGSVGEGFWLNHVEGQALRGLKGRDLLTPARQVAILQRSDALPWRRPDIDPVLHADPPPRRPLGSDPARRSDAPMACVRELVITKILFVYSGFGQKDLRVLVSLEDYEDGAAAPFRRFTGWGDAKLADFPPRQGDDVDAAIGRLEQGFAGALADYAKRANTALGQDGPPHLARKQ